MPISNYNTGFPNGVTIRNVPILDMQNGDGNVFWVDYHTGSNENKGTFTFPFKTLKYALTKAVAGQADKIYLAAGHTETITDDTLDINVQGVQIIGLGLEQVRPIFTFTTSTSAKITISGYNAYLGNILFRNSQSGLVLMLDIAGAGITLENCFLQAHASTLTNFINVQHSDFRMINCEVNAIASCDSAIIYAAGINDNQFIDCNFYGSFTESCFYIPSSLSTGVTNIFIDGGRYANTAADITAYLLQSLKAGSTGVVSDSVSIRVANPERLPIYNVEGSDIGKGKQGDIISFSTIIPVAAVAGSSSYLLKVASGSFYIEDACVETDNAGLAGATNLEIDESLDPYGQSTFYAETIANLGAAATVALKDASVSSTTRALTTGGTISVNKTGATLTGVDFRVSFTLRALENGSVIIKNPSF